jgi:hypothetical protein
MKPDKTTTTCEGCGAIHDIDALFEKDGKAYCANCKPEGARSYAEYVKEHTKVLTPQEMIEIAYKSPLEVLDLATVRPDKFKDEIARTYGVGADEIKLVGVSLYFATDDRKVMMTMREFAGHVGQLLFDINEDAQQRKMAADAIAKMILAQAQPGAQPGAHQCACKDGCGSGSAAKKEAQAPKEPGLDMFG